MKTRQANLLSLLVILIFTLFGYGCGDDNNGSNNGNCSGVPEVPENLVAEPVSLSQIALSWTDNSDNEDGFTIERTTDPDFVVDITNIPISADTTSYNDSGLNADTTYYYRISTYNTAGSSGYSDIANARTFEPSEPVVSRDDVLSMITGNIYYLDAVSGSDELGDGSSAMPWRSLAKVDNVLESGDGVIIRDGEYGEFSTNNTYSDWVIYINEEGSLPEFTNIKIRFDPIDPLPEVRILFYGIKVSPEWVDPCDSGEPGCDDPYYEESTSYTYAKTETPLNLNYTKFIKLYNCEIVGTNKFLSPGLTIRNSDDIVVKGCHIYKVITGFLVYRSNNIQISYNKIHEIIGTHIQDGGYCSYISIESNHAYDKNWSLSDAYCPRAPGQTIHGSFVSIRSSNTTIRNNIFHDGGSSSGMMFYTDSQSEDSFSDILIENNLMYDPHTNTVMRIYRLGENVILRNNTFVGRGREGGYTGVYEYNVVFSLSSIADGYSASGLHLHNNVFVGAANLEEWWGEVDENNNIFWSALDHNNDFLSQDDITSSSKIVTSSGTSDYFRVGFFNGELDVSWPNMFDDPIPVNAPGHGKLLDFTLAPGSEGINFGDPDNQSSTSLGTLSQEGFIQLDGALRDSEHHSAGCYEYDVN